METAESFRKIEKIVLLNFKATKLKLSKVKASGTRQSRQGRVT
jgi:hypothetical protein